MKTSLFRLTPLAAALALSACATAGPTTATLGPPTALDQWTDRVQIVPTPDEILLAAHPTGLSGNQARALSDFQARWMQAEGGMITIAAPSEGGYKVGSDARSFLLDLGVRPDLVRLVGYEGGGRPGAPVVVGFQRYAVATPTCGSWDAVTKSFNNEPQGNLGCAVTSNMAAQLANPRDWTGTRPIDPADPNRRATVFDKYRKGELTATPRDDQATGTVSEAIK
jgi:pilus assembly protein CpaD